MKKSINEFRSILTETEKLSTLQLCHLKGGGEDLRRNTLLSTTVSTTTTTVSVKI